MNCPQCNQTLTQINQPRPGTPHEKKIYYCEHCGWGKQQFKTDDRVEPTVSAATPNTGSATLLKLSLLWALSVALVVVPYVLLVNIPFLFSGADPAIFNPEEASAKVAAMLNPLYWVIVGTYILICATFQSPDVDWNDLGWFGGLVNNPFSYSDNINRHRLVLLLMMMPGKIVVVTFTATYRLIQQAVAK